MSIALEPAADRRSPPDSAAKRVTLSGFTFLRNARMLGFPAVESIRSVLPICDEFVVNVGRSEDDTLEMIRSIGSEKVRILQSEWNDNMRDRGYVYGQQKMIAQFNCTGEWAFYLEGDEVVHEDDLPKIRAAIERHRDDPRVEALSFDYYHFYGNGNSCLWSPGWYRREARIIRNTIRTCAPDGLFWVVLEKNRKGRYPRAAHTGAHIYHYGWVRSEAAMNLKSRQVQRYWSKAHAPIDYGEIDPAIIRRFDGAHPHVIRSWLPPADAVFAANPDHRLTRKEKRHRWMLVLERLFGWELSKKHFVAIK